MKLQQKRRCVAPARKKNTEIKRYIRIAEGQIITELSLLERKTTHPELFSSEAPAPTSSPLHWGGTPTELAELITALSEIKIIKQENGRSAPLTEVVRCFEQVLNINLGEAHDMRRKILRRKTRLTIFIDRLKESIRD